MFAVRASLAACTWHQSQLHQGHKLAKQSEAQHTFNSSTYFLPGGPQALHIKAFAQLPLACAMWSAKNLVVMQHAPKLCRLT